MERFELVIVADRHDGETAESLTGEVDPRHSPG